MFGKDYDGEIKKQIVAHNELVSNVNNLIKNLNSLHKLFESLQNSVLNIAKVQAQHKQIISFLLNHVTVDEDAHEDLTKMMQNIIKLEKEFKSKISEIDKKDIKIKNRIVDYDKLYNAMIKAGFKPKEIRERIGYKNV